MQRSTRPFALLPFGALACLGACVVRPDGVCLEPLRTPRGGVVHPCPGPPGGERALAKERERALLGFTDPPGARAAIRLEVEETIEGLRDEPLPFSVAVHNEGDGTARDLIVLVALPAEVRASRALSILELALPRLAAGESATLRETLVGERAGEHPFQAVASLESGELFGPVKGVLRIREPEPPPGGVTLGPDPEPRSAGAAAPAPDGERPRHAANARAPRALPVGWREAAPAPVEPTPSTASDTSAPPRPVQPTVEGAVALAGATRSEPRSEALALELEGSDEPVIAGDLSCVRIHLENHGAVPARDLELSVALDPRFELVTCSGATDGLARGSTVAIEPLTTLGAGRRATWKLVLRSIEPGDALLEAQLSGPGDELLACASRRTRYVALAP